MTKGADVPLLGQDYKEEQDAPPETSVQLNRLPSPRPSTAIFLVAVCALLLVQEAAIAVSFALGIINFSTPCPVTITPAHSISHSPADAAIRYEPRLFDKDGHLTSPFSQPPGPAADLAWHNLLRGMNIRVAEQDLERNNASSVRFRDGRGYLAQLGLYHELHCLKKIKHWIYREHYMPDLPSEQAGEEQAHIEHCLEWLRIAALCRGDTTLTTFFWDHDRLETAYPIQRQCVDSDALLAWSEGHAVDLGRETLVKSSV